jgi:hypothetical protein
MILKQLIVQLRKKYLLMQVQKDTAKLLNIKNLHAMATHRNDWTKNQESQTICQRAIGRRKSFLIHVVAQLNF